jgi:hypothetical protein
MTRLTRLNFPAGLICLPASFLALLRNILKLKARTGLPLHKSSV